MLRQIKNLSLVMCFLNAANLLLINTEAGIVPQMALFLPVILLSFIIIYFFYKGRNWARVLIMIGSALNLVFLFLGIALFTEFIQRSFIILEGIFSAYILFFLSRKEVLSFFKNPSKISRPVSKRSLFIRIAAVIAVIIVLTLGGIGALFHKLSTSFDNMNICVEEIKTGSMDFLTEDGANSQPSFSPDGEKIVYVHSKTVSDKRSLPEIRIISLKDRAVQTAVAGENGNNHPSWIGGNSRIAYVSGDAGSAYIRSIDLNSGETKNIYEGPGSISGLFCSPDGKWLLFRSRPDNKSLNDLYLISSSGGEKIRLTNTSNFLLEPQYPAWLKGSKEIVYSSLTSLVIIGLDGRFVESIDLPGLNNIFAVFCHPGDSDTLFFKAHPTGSFSGNLYRLSRKTGGFEVLRKAGFSEFGYDISPNGGNLVFVKPSPKKK